MNDEAAIDPSAPLTAPEPPPLAGCRVLELGSLVAGPFCGRLLGDFGAEVIKVEQAEGDPVRAMSHRDRGKSLYAAAIMRNKRNVVVDLRKPEGQAIVRRLIARCDILVENFRPGTLERWGLGYEALRREHPELILVRVSGFGQDGPYSQRPGYGIIGEALSGLRRLTGDPDRPPARVSLPLTDYLAGLYAALGTVLAVVHRQRTGRGQVVDTALNEAAFSLLESEVASFDRLGIVADRAGSRLPGHAPNNLYTTRDGQHLHVAAANQSLFLRLLEVMDRRELADDPRFATPVARAEHHEAVDGVVQEWIGRHDLDTVEPLLQDAQVTAARIYSVADIFTDPHYRARGMLARVPDEELGTVTLPGVVPRLSASPGRIGWAGRRAGRDTAAVLEELLGLSPEEIAALEACGAIRCDRGNTEPAP
jgi:crotonobetainyl-CoA:carnitine CoA-transferase CaiB-like acyl-CoA transferase